MKKFTVYVLKSEATNRFYVGHTRNIQQRLAMHNSHRVRSTKAYAPWVVVYSEEVKTRLVAYAREMQIKSYKGGEAFKKLIY